MDARTGFFFFLKNSTKKKLIKSYSGQEDVGGHVHLHPERIRHIKNDLFILAFFVFILMAISCGASMSEYISFFKNVLLPKFFDPDQQCLLSDEKTHHGTSVLLKCHSAPSYATSLQQSLAQCIAVRNHHPH